MPYWYIGNNMCYSFLHHIRTHNLHNELICLIIMKMRFNAKLERIEWSMGRGVVFIRSCFGQSNCEWNDVMIGGVWEFQQNYENFDRRWILVS